MKLTRRQFLKLAGVTGAALVPAALGYRFLLNGAGAPPNFSPYAAEPAQTLSLAEPSPIAILTDEHSANPFGAYLAEILRAEGLTGFQQGRLSAASPTLLERCKLIVLAESAWDQAQAELFAEYVARGGRLIAMRPGARVDALFGITRLDGNTRNGYLQIASKHSIGQGIASTALQFHGEADHYHLAGAEAVASLVESNQVSTEYPALTWHRFGKGQAALWAFDLAKSVAYTRQGNPEWVNQERDDRPGIRAVDAFIGWMDLARLAFPQADQLMRLLSQLITQMLADAIPVPRLWYFPGFAETMLIATGDSHASPVAVIEQVLQRVEQHGGSMSVYYTPPPLSELGRAARRLSWQLSQATGVAPTDANTLPTSTQVARWRARGHEFNFHPYVEDGLETSYRRYWKEFTELGYTPISTTARTHRILWTGWAETARVQATYGVRMNLDFYHYGPIFLDNAGKGINGFFTGSGLPMRFVDPQGRILNIYQQATQLVDEHLMKMTWGGGWANLDGAAAVEVSEWLLARCLGGAFAAITGQFHVDPFAAGGDFAANSTRWLEGTLDYAVAHNIPIWSAARWLDFIEQRADCNFKNLQWNPTSRQLSFQINGAENSNEQITALIPVQSGTLRLKHVLLDDATAEVRERKLGGIEYGWVAMRVGTHQIIATYA